MVEIVSVTGQEVPRKNVLSRGVLAYKDILDQTPSKYFLIVDTGPGSSLLMSVDSVDVNNGSVSAFDKDRNVISRFNAELPWYMVSADYSRIVTTEEYAKGAAADHKAMHEFERQMRDSKQLCEEQVGQVSEIPGALPAVPTGQYL